MATNKMPTKDIPLYELQIGKKYKLKEWFEMGPPYLNSKTPDGKPNGTIQEDIDLISSGFYELLYLDDEYFDARFFLPPGKKIYVPEENRSRDSIFLNGLVWNEYADGINTLFEEEDEETLLERALEENKEPKEETYFEEDYNDPDVIQAIRILKQLPTNTKPNSSQKTSSKLLNNLLQSFKGGRRKTKKSTKKKTKRRKQTKKI